ncbi:MAG: pseudaminic acid synthase [Candidatus Xenobiia bacterium LiM19]
MSILNNNNVFIVAELSANHLHQIDLAIKTIHEIKKAGADAVKIQTYTPDTLTIDCENDCFKATKGTLWEGKTLYELYKEAYTPWDWHEKLKKEAESLDLVFFSTPFDKSAVDFLENLGISIYKIASCEITDIHLIRYIASKQKPVIISTGIATLTDIEEAVTTCKNVGNYDLALLKCTSSYPTPYEEVNLKTIPHLAATFDITTGISDHTLGIGVPIAAAALGAKIIEKHFIIDRNLGGPDAAFSLEPHEFGQMVTSVREVEKALGSITYNLSEMMKKGRQFARSLFVVEDMRCGDIFNTSNVRSIRPANGLHPRFLNDIIGRRASQNIQRGTPLSWSLVC